jgi:predicted metalloprotease with PDZ domain
MAKTISTTSTMFTVAMSRPATHLYEIEMDVVPFGRAVTSFDLCLPVWTPGSYCVRDYARNVRDLCVTGASGEPLAVTKVEKSRWRVAVGPKAARGPFRVSYRVYAFELTVRTSHLDASHGYGNGASLFLYVDGRKDEPQRLRFRLPRGWKTSIALPRREGAFLAASYDELVDSPFECGTHRTFLFRVRGVPHTLALWGAGNEDPERLVRDLTRLAETAAELFGGLPYRRYLFLVHLADGARGGLEHRASQSCGVTPWKFRPDSTYREVLSLFSHELFHAWNVKRIHPEALGPFDYSRETYLRDLWALEGVTSYYEHLVLVRAGLEEPKHAFEAWAKDVKEHRDTPGHRVQNVEEASFDAWIRLYHPDENSPNVSESYYRRGALVGLALDLTIRAATRGRRSLDDVVLALWRRWGSRGKPYPDGTWEAEVKRVGGAAVAEFFDHYVRGVETPPFEELFPAAGLHFREKPEKEEGNGADATAVRERADLGWKTKAEGGKLVVVEVYDGRAAYAAGVSANDEIVAIDGVKADEEQLKRIVRDAAPGQTVRLHLFRLGRLLELPLVLGARRAFTYEIVPDPAGGGGARALFEGWLRSPFPETRAGGSRDPRLEQA